MRLLDGEYELRFFDYYKEGDFSLSSGDWDLITTLFNEETIKGYFNVAGIPSLNYFVNTCLNSYEGWRLNTETLKKLPKDNRWHNDILDDYCSRDDWVDDSEGNARRLRKWRNGLKADIVGWILKQVPRLTIYAHSINPDDLKTYSDRWEEYKENYKDRGVSIGTSDSRNFDYPQLVESVILPLDTIQAAFNTDNGKVSLKQTAALPNLDSVAATDRAQSKTGDTDSTERDTNHRYDWGDKNTDKVKQTGLMLDNNIKTIINWSELGEIIGRSFLLVSNGYDYE